MSSSRATVVYQLHGHPRGWPEIFPDIPPRDHASELYSQAASARHLAVKYEALAASIEDDLAFEAEHVLPPSWWSRRVYA